MFCSGQLPVTNQPIRVNLLVHAAAPAALHNERNARAAAERVLRALCMHALRNAPLLLPFIDV
jgi:hypothetical protein